MDKRLLINTLVSSVGGALIGGAITYVTVKKTFAERAQRDIDDVKASYAAKFDGKKVVNVYNSPADVEATPVPGANLSEEQRAEAEEFVRQLGYRTVTPAPDGTVDAEEEQKLSIYDRNEKPPKGVKEKESLLLRDYDGDKLRLNHKPYLISEEEFRTTETEWDKSDIIYYEDDDTLTDEDERPVDDIEYLIGEVHLDFFGIRSGDPNVVYVRAPQISTDYKVHRHSGSYTEIVLNIPKGSDRVGTRRNSRDGDDD
jgi:hypothetical protein